MQEIEPAGEFFQPYPLLPPQRIGCGHGLRSGRPVVILGVAHDEEDVQVSSLTPDQADCLAQKLRSAAGAVRSLIEQEGT